MTDVSDAPAVNGVVVFRGNGEMAALMRSVDWSATPLGPVDTWSASLRTTVSTLLASRHAMFLWWGPDLIQFYNDGYRPSLGPDRHPSAIGQPGRECWAEIWPTIGHEVEAIMAGGDSTWHEDHLVPITRGDRVQDVYWSYSYSPVQDDDGSVGGVLVTVQETTRRVVSERRTRLLRKLVTDLQHASNSLQVCDAATASLRDASNDVTFARVHLAGAEPSELDGSEVADDRLTMPLPTALPKEDPHGVLVLGLSPRLPLDTAYREFATHVAREIASALDRVRLLAQERRMARAAADAERHLLEGVFELSPAFLAVLRGPEHVFELANPAYYQLVGHRELVGRRVIEALPEIAGQGFLELLDRVYHTGAPFVGSELAVQLQVEPGSALDARIVNFVYQPMHNAEGTVTGILASGVDVTSLAHAREAAELARTEAERLAAAHDIERRQLLTVLEQSPLGVAIAEAPSGRLRFTNRKFAETIGHARQVDSAADYSTHYRGFHLDGRTIASHEWPMSRAVAHGETVEGEILVIEQEGGRRLEVAFNAAPVRDAAGDITAGVLILRDVTDERRLEHQLRDTQRLQAVGTLAGGVAHEINNQMTVVLGFGEFILRSLGPEHEQAPDMRLVLTAGQRAARVSQELLAFTRQQVTRPRLLDLEAVVTELKPVLEQLLGSDKVLSIKQLGRVSPVNADPDQVHQLLINLVANARDATETGDEVSIVLGDVTVESELPAPPGEPVAPGQYVRLSVIDTGSGMSAETLARIFDPFFTTKAVGQGTGLGLPMVYGTVRRHGGYTVARSVPGSGTTMELYWPPAPEAGKEAEGGSAVDRRRKREPGGGTLILVAEDEPVVRRLAVRTLEQAGYRVLAAADGAEALDMLEREPDPPEVVVMDVIMPRMNGRQLADAVRVRWPRVALLFISGHTGEGDVLERLVPPGAPFLQKPFTPDGLVRAVGALRPR